MPARTSIYAVLGVMVGAFLLAGPIPGHAQDGVSEELEGIFVIGSRREIRSVADTPTPIAVVQPEDLTQAGVSDVSSLLRTAIPSWNVNAQPIADAATIIRPPNLRGFASDQSLVFLNGKRRHRAAVISFFGGGVSDGAQGPDVSVIPAIALKRIEVLKDSASAQYGSDAIAGVINFVLKDAPEGGAVEVQWGRTYEGDGDEYRISTNVGIPMGGAGFLNVSAEFREAEPTSRSVQRPDAQALIDAGHPDVLQPYAQEWGRPETRDDYKLFANFGLDAGLYAFGNYARREVEGGFFFRNPTGTPGVFTDASGNFLIVNRRDRQGTEVDSTATCNDIDIPAGAHQPGDYYTEVGNVASTGTDTTGLNGDDCFSFGELFPGGFTPSFGGEAEDLAGAIGFRNELGSGLGYDVSLTIGQNRVDHFISNTVNASLGQHTPRSFDLGAYIQTEHTVNADLTYPLEVEFFASPLNIAAGFEWREEEFKITQGEEASWMLGPYAQDGFLPGANGFSGFRPESAGTWSRSNIALYLDMEGDLENDVTVSTALRWEDFEDFGTTTDFKVAALKRMNDWLNIRGSVNTGFRVPTIGQENVLKLTTDVNAAGQLQLSGTLPPGHALSRSCGAVALEPEESLAFSAGFVIDHAPLALTVDGYRIDVKDRLGLSQQFNQGSCYTSDTYRQIRYFGNGFDTRTQGFDLVSAFDLPEGSMGLGQGVTDFVFAFNYTKTDVTDQKAGFLDNVRITQLEQGLPRYRFNGTLRHEQESWRGLVRVNHFGPTKTFNLSQPIWLQETGAEHTFDVEAGLRVWDGVELVLGATNLFNNFPDKTPPIPSSAPHLTLRSFGSEYAPFAPGGLDGGFYYTRLQYTW